MVTSPPARLMSALPSGIASSPSGTSPFIPYSTLCSKNITRSSSRIEASSRPLASAGVDGATHLMPGMCVNTE